MPFHNHSTSTDNQAVHELRDDLKDLNRTLKRTNKTGALLTLILIILAVVQVIIAFFQLIVPYFTTNPIEAWKGVAVEIVILGIIVWLLKDFNIKEMMDNIKMEKIKIPTTKNKKIAAVIHTPDEITDRLAILCPGYLDTKDYDHLVKLANELTDEGYTVIRFDPTGTWESSGAIAEYTVSQYINDIKIILDYALKDNDYQHILVGGHSKGGMVAILSAIKDPRISCVCAIMAPYSLSREANKKRDDQWQKDGFKTSLRDIPHKKEKREFRVPYSYIEDAKNYNLLDVIEKLHIPLILLAGERDNLIPPEDIKLIFDKANDPKKLIVVNGVGHDYRRRRKEIEKVNKAILKALPPFGF